MILKSWDQLPEKIRKSEVKPYFDLLSSKKTMLIIKRIFDISVSFIAIVILIPFFAIIAIAICFDSKGPIFYRQNRITQYGKIFRIYKFRTMVVGADKSSLITSLNDSRVTRVGAFLRKTKIDELPQLFNVFLGDMSFVGTRPEVQKYVDVYTNEMMATLLLPAGLTSLASVNYSEENTMISSDKKIDEIYINEILPKKMELNLKELSNFSNFNDLVTLFKTFTKLI